MIVGARHVHFCAQTSMECFQHHVEPMVLRIVAVLRAKGGPVGIPVLEFVLLP